ncbi:uncharacterized protein LOC121728899 [Aricia agestis]|uniref:uncharacterized protein LOC121728899 n=1 Tax=Aricia agestis TaxID=91739 RepID=UPI001C209EFC|nr:uncharacterized protein LOC121728899 [Aricia agestis]
MDAILNKNVHFSDDVTPQPPEEVEVWAPWTIAMPAKSPKAPPPVHVRTAAGPAWDIDQVLKAARLLSKPPLTVNFEDEQEMRAVYALIYEVFRYKSILDQAIDDVNFFGNYPQFRSHRHITWLFLMELARRRWVARSQEEVESAKSLLAAAGEPFLAVETAIWDERVHFAAAIARIRIKNKAFSLSELLPPHLREERVSATLNRTTLTGWVNTFKAKKLSLLVEDLRQQGYTYSTSRQLCAGEFRFDRVCPRFITLRPPANQSIGQLDLIKNGVIVLQEREFCEGASTLCRALQANSLCGVVAQTHASSPRCSAYLAALLKELAAVIRAQKPPAPVTPELGRLVVFGAGDRLESYVSALQELGVEASDWSQSDSSVCVLREAIHCDCPTVTSALTGVVAAIATPPNSYSAVTDPIDLVCGRGGDLAMLEILTESEIDSESRARVQNVLEEQKKTLKALMSKPQIQLILYETHSSLDAENTVQVTRAVAEANRLAREKHALKKKHKDHSSVSQMKEASSTTTLDLSRSDLDKEDDDVTTPRTRPMSSPPATARTEATVVRKRAESADVDARPNEARPIPEMHADDPIPHDPDKDCPNVFVPDTDLFEIHQLPHLNNGVDIHNILDKDGCYLGLIQRKEITRLDAKYMIRVAEERGLFGAGSPAPRRKRHETDKPKQKRHKQTFEVERVAAPTYASLWRAHRRGSAPARYTGAGMNDSGGGSSGRSEGGSGGGGGSVTRVCSRHERRWAAANTHAVCACIAKHRPQQRERRASTGESPACRQLYPVVVHDLRLKRVRYNIVA